MRSLILSILVPMCLCVGDVGWANGQPQIHIRKEIPLLKRWASKFWQAKGKVWHWASGAVVDENGNVLRRQWRDTLKRTGKVYAIVSLAVMPLCSNLTCAQRSVNGVASEVLQGGMAEHRNLTIYTDNGEEHFGYWHDKIRLVQGSNPSKSAIVPYVAHWDLVPVANLDSFFKTEGLWELLNWDLWNYWVAGKMIDRQKVIEVEFVDILRGAGVEIKAGKKFLQGRELAKLKAKYDNINGEQGQEFYAVLIDAERVPNSRGDYDEIKVNPYFKFVTQDLQPVFAHN